MKNVILCEGKNDTFLLDRLSKKLSFDQNKLKIFIQNSGNTPSEKNREESVVLRSFFGRWNPREVLIKAEGGKDMVVDAFSFFMSYLFGLKENAEFDKLILIVDFNSGRGRSDIGLDNFISKIRPAIGSRAGKSLEVEYRLIRKNECLSTSEISIVIRKSPKVTEKLGTFLLTAFDISLEDEAKIDETLDNDDVKKSKIEKLLRNDGFVEHFSYVFQ